MYASVGLDLRDSNQPPLAINYAGQAEFTHYINRSILFSHHFI